MRIFLAGATGAIGTRLIPLLRAAGHHVTGMTRFDGKVHGLRALHAEPVVGDVFDRERLLQLVADAEPDLVLHQLTDLPDDAAHLGAFRARNARMRREGTPNLIEAAQAAGVDRIISQSIAWQLPEPESQEAVETLERLTLEANGVVLRYGQFWGPGTFHQEAPREGPHVHIDTAAERTVGLLGSPSGVIEVLD